jgi:hypothetical protein
VYLLGGWKVYLGGLMVVGGMGGLMGFRWLESVSDGVWWDCRGSVYGNVNVLKPFISVM